MKTTELIALLVEQLAKHGDKPVTGILPKYGEWEAKTVRYDPKNRFTAVILG